MTKKTIAKIFVYFIGLVMPILAMLNCNGFDGGNMKVSHCFIDSSLIRSYADFYFGWLLISSFMVFIPVIIYVGIVVLVAKYFSKVFDNKIEQ